MTNFTTEQVKFINHKNGHALCVAGAGTGKTTTLVALIQKKLSELNQDEALVLMFNRDIMIDFKRKLNGLNVELKPPVLTFHSFCLNVLKKFKFFQKTGHRLEYNHNEKDKNIARKVLNKMSENIKDIAERQIYKEPKTLELLVNFVGLVKAYLLEPKEVFDISEISKEYLFIIQAYDLYEVERKKEKLLFFDDWIVEAVGLLENNDHIKEFYQNKLKLVVVDEFQDINPAQHKLIKLMLGEKSQLIAVGDVDQCIYKWRGSAPHFMLNFEKDFAPCDIYHLSHTFRFGHSLALASSHLISKNKERFHDFLTVSHSNVDNTDIKVMESNRQVGDIIQSIHDYLCAGGKASDIAILVRRWSQTLLFELAFLTKNIDYVIPIPSILVHSKEVKLIIYLMLIVTGKFDSLDLRYKANIAFLIFTFPHCYIVTGTLVEICEYLSKLSIDQWIGSVETLKQKYPNAQLDVLKKRIEVVLTLKTKKNQKATQIFKEYREQSRLDKWIWKTQTTLSDIEETIERLNSVDKILESLDYSCEQALNYFEYYTKRSFDRSQKHKDTDQVKLTTIFRAKGCEFEHVYLPYWEKGEFPYTNRLATGMNSEIEDERRLAYVALTRAKQSAKIFYSKNKDASEKVSRASQFIFETDHLYSQNLGLLLYGSDDEFNKGSELSEQYILKAGKSVVDFKPYISSDVKEFNYDWAIQQKVKTEQRVLLNELITTKTIKYLDKELKILTQKLQKEPNDNKLSNRLIMIAHAKYFKLVNN
ncbi:ATP-dependent helicase [Paraphotobacterium marinum]|uniref:ATP-dependent helicase n=1 Tax=Paraphotobacterium marinum TaxID=1755811 RepID=UPI0039EB1127